MEKTKLKVLFLKIPILARNGELAKRILITALQRKYPDADLSKQQALEIKPTY